MAPYNAQPAVLPEADIVLIHAKVGMDTKYKTAHETSSNENCQLLAKWAVKNGRTPDPRAADADEQFIGKFLERKRSGRAKAYESDQTILSSHGLPNLFERADSLRNQVLMAKEVCKVLKENGCRIPSRTQGPADMRRIGHWIRNRRAAAHGALQLSIPTEVLRVFKDEGLLHVLHLAPPPVSADSQPESTGV